MLPHLTKAAILVPEIGAVRRDETPEPLRVVHLDHVAQFVEDYVINQIRCQLFQALYEVPSNLVLVSEWQREAQGAVRREIHAKRRHFHNAKVSLTSYVTDTSAAPADVLVDDSASAVVRDLGAALTELTLHGRYFGQYTLTVVLYDRDPVALERSVGACLKAFAAHDAQVTDERYNLLNAWLAVLPGNGAYSAGLPHPLRPGRQ